MLEHRLSATCDHERERPVIPEVSVKVLLPWRVKAKTIDSVLSYALQDVLSSMKVGP